MNILFLKEKRDECITKLYKSTIRLYLQEFLSIYDRVKIANRKPRELLKEFQHAIRKISSWSVDDIRQEHQRFRNSCELFDSLVKSIFKLHLAIYNTMHESKFDANIPNPGQYMHETYLTIARRLWKDPSLLYDVKVDKMTYQKNIMRLEKIISKCVNETFLCMLPFKEFDELIAKDEIEEEDVEIEDEIEEEDVEIEDIIEEEDVEIEDSIEEDVEIEDIIEENIEENIEIEDIIEENIEKDYVEIEDMIEVNIEKENLDKETKDINKNELEDIDKNELEDIDKNELEDIDEELDDKVLESEDYVDINRIFKNKDIKDSLENEGDVNEHLEIKLVNMPVTSLQDKSIIDLSHEISHTKTIHETAFVPESNLKIITIAPARRTLADRKKLVKNRVKQDGFSDFATPKDSFF